MRLNKISRQKIVRRAKTCTLPRRPSDLVITKVTANESSGRLCSLVAFQVELSQVSGFDIRDSVASCSGDKFIKLPIFRGLGDAITSLALHRMVEVSACSFLLPNVSACPSQLWTAVEVLVSLLVVAKTLSSSLSP